MTRRLWRRWRLLVLVAVGLGMVVAWSQASPAIAQEPASDPQQPAPTPPAIFDRDHVQTTVAILQQAVRESIRRGQPSVVAIARQRLIDPNQLNPAQKRVWEAGPSHPDFAPQEYFGGVVVAASGSILTAYHGLGDPPQNRYWVWLPGRTEPLLARGVKAADPWMDLAVLEVDADGLEPIAWGDADQAFKGQFVVALSNPVAQARDGEPSASWGVISQLRRSAPLLSTRPETGGRETIHHFGTLLETDIRDAPLSSGGALLNLDGELIGVLTTLSARAAAERLAGFAIPIDAAARRAVEEMLQGRSPTYGFLGIEPGALSEAQRQRGLRGVEIRDLVGATPAQRAGLRPGDILVAVNDQAVEEPLDVTRLVSREPAGSLAHLDLQRAGRAMHVPVELAKRPLQSLRPAIAQIEPPRWRGAQVDYFTVAAEFSRWSSTLRERLPLTVVDVQEDSATWKAGLRPGDIILSFAGQESFRPADFHRALDDRQGEIALEVMTAGQLRRLTVGT